MASVSKRRTGELIRKLFQLLKQHPDGMRATDALKALEAEVTLTEH